MQTFCILRTVDVTGRLRSCCQFNLWHMKKTYVWILFWYLITHSVIFITLKQCLLDRERSCCWWNGWHVFEWEGKIQHITYTFKNETFKATWNALNKNSFPVDLYIWNRGIIVGAEETFLLRGGGGVSISQLSSFMVYCIWMIWRLFFVFCFWLRSHWVLVWITMWLTLPSQARSLKWLHFHRILNQFPASLCSSTWLSIKFSFLLCPTE